jgi:hypothetical protein
LNEKPAELLNFNENPDKHPKFEWKYWQTFWIWMKILTVIFNLNENHANTCVFEWKPANLLNLYEKPAELLNLSENPDKHPKFEWKSWQTS